jgi:nicotinate-nucleotide pyrophosphorylase (carboxylating)
MSCETRHSIEEAINKLVKMALEEDLHELGDVTSKATIAADKLISANIVAKAPGVIAGLFAVQAVYNQINPGVAITLHVQDGDIVAPGALVCTISGNGRAILSGERTALNFLQRLSGIATLTAKFVQETSGTEAVILDTRKTTPGWRILEKHAVAMGGGQNHRMGLYDAVMIKDNHIDSAGGITAAVNAVRDHPEAKGLQIVVEVRDKIELEEAAGLKIDRILLDNMNKGQMRDAVKLVGGRISLEASGNITLDRVSAVARTGVNYISVGELTHSAPILDLSMKIQMQ